MSRFHHRLETRRGWSAIRARAIRAAGRRCTRCGLPGRLEVHHAVPLSRGGDNRSPVVVLCRDCHLQQHRRPDPARVAWSRFLLEEFSHAEKSRGGVEAV